MKSLFDDFFASQSKKPVVGVDIGGHSIKFTEIHLPEGKALSEGAKPIIVAFGSQKLPPNVFSGSLPVKKEVIGECLVKLFETHQVDTNRISFSLPCSAVFTKKISVTKSVADNLESNIAFEASNYIPHRIDAINLDYQILGESGGMTDVLLVAVKHEILDVYRQIFELIDLEPVIADVESLACFNVFELSCKESLNKTIALLDIGYRHTTVSIINNGSYILSGDLSLGSKNYVDALMQALDLNSDQAELLLKGKEVPGTSLSLIDETIDKITEYVASELQRQIGFFWNGAGLETQVAELWLTGGGSRVPRFQSELRSRLNTPCHLIDSSSSFEFSTDLKAPISEEEISSYNLCLGLGLRRSSDKQV